MSGGTLPDIAFFQFALMLNAIAAFVVLYGLAIYYRRQPLQHARYMGCTVFPLFTPITDRLIYAHWPSLTSLVPRSTASRSCSCSASRWRTACCWLS